MIRDPRQVEVHPVHADSGCRTYVVIAPDTREAAIVDPLLMNLSETLGVLDGERGKLRWIIETHSHGDHVSGAAALKKRTGAEVVAHPELPGDVPTLRATDGQVLEFGEHGLLVHHAPGNSRDALVVQAKGCYFTGDTILIGTVGLQDTDSVDADAWYDSLDRIFGEEPDETVLHVGHDDMGRDRTTVGAERRGNRWLREDDREKFRGIVEGDERVPRKDRDRVLDANREGVIRVPRDLAPAAGLTAPAELAEQRAREIRGKPPPAPSAPPPPAHHGVLVLCGFLAAIGTILGWMVNPALHGLSLLAAVILLAFGLPAFERSRRRRAQPDLYYEGPASHRLTS
ncbi:MAG: MBL fold metallo-hydrolase [Planctomycetota bacterium]|nr:MBL fold metallo-hydrolase [Planctomycetota bacterium]